MNASRKTVVGGWFPTPREFPSTETHIGRRQLRMVAVNEQRVRVTNCSASVAVEVTGNGRLEPGADVVATLPVTVLLPADYTVMLTATAATTIKQPLQDLGEATVAPGHSTIGASWSPGEFESNDNAERLVQALQATPSQTVLQKLVRDKKTVWQRETMQEAASLAEVERVIAAPILNVQGELIAALYCDRHQQANNTRAITRLDARFIELLAGGVAAGLARMEQEAAARRMTTQFEQFFTPELTRELAANPDLLEGRDADVSILFCDIRGFSRISERIGAQATFAWINDVMGVLSECVTKQQGVLVDYIGDELMAMWGAPQAEPNHATLACRAALDMLQQLPALNERWQDTIGEPVDLGIGINSGPVRAGNAGSPQKFKYSPLGNTVNLASRVQGASKYLKTRLLITNSTADQLSDDQPRRKLCSVQVVNIEQAVELYELITTAEASSTELCNLYERALAEFEQHSFRKAAQTLSTLLSQFPDDGPALVLLKRTVVALVDGVEQRHPHWILGGK